MGLIRVWFEGDLSADYIITNIERSYPSHELRTVEVPGVDGMRYLGSVYRIDGVTMTIHATGTEVERRGKLRRLMGILDVGNPRPLVLSDDVLPDGRMLRRFAVPAKVEQGPGHVRSSSVRVEFAVTEVYAEACADPWETGSTAIVGGWASASGEASDTMGGTYPGAVRVSVANYPILTWSRLSAGTWEAASAKQWGGHGGGGQYIDYTIAGSRIRARVAGSAAQSAALTIDTDARTVTLGAKELQVTLDSDWPDIYPGDFGIASNDGSDFTYRKIERWL